MDPSLASETGIIDHRAKGPHTEGVRPYRRNLRYPWATTGILRVQPALEASIGSRVAVAACLPVSLSRDENFADSLKKSI